MSAIFVVLPAPPSTWGSLVDEAAGERFPTTNALCRAPCAVVAPALAHPNFQSLCTSLRAPGAPGLAVYASGATWDFQKVRVLNAPTI